ncbi:esterase-like activity of phytase family protein [Marivita hallyeonensis]|uniref:Phytase-like domain-containing protein n=1 Tax=Marivita hallyeonensis TaxID=996342 RepID=A0A1M5UIJ5_9RHOB|nr:esterase-like activity of phytase family protein [Marivita hallyeonensis]SHH62835.1 hypothetical protein SAMN05443551_2663 [Marivita hallyeonensis]
MTAETARGTQNPAARFLSSYLWTKDQDDFGGYSAISLSPDGASFLMLSDRAHVIEGTILRHGERILGVRSKAMSPLDFSDSLFEEEPIRDTEGLARDTSGGIFVSLESDNRILHLTADGTWSLLPEYAGLAGLPSNKGVEALAVGSDGALFAVPETSAGLIQPFPVFRYREGIGWDTPFEISRGPGLLPVGADFDPMGRLYLLERGFSGFGFFSRVRRFDLLDGPVLEGETLLETKQRRHDNLEGLSIWQAETGELRITMVSDDNFSRFQKTEIVEYAISN